MNPGLEDQYKETYHDMLYELQRLTAALTEIAELSYFYEETAWTWSDISKKQTDIARAALSQNKAFPMDLAAK